MGDNYNHQCIACIDEYYLNIANCFKNCTYYHYFDDLHIHHCTIDEKCPEDKNKLILERGECVEDCSKDNNYKYEYNNICYNYNILPETTLLIINNYNQKSLILDEDKIISEFIYNSWNNIKESQIKEVKNGNDLLLTENNGLKISLTTSDNKIKKNKNISLIDLGECEDKLKEFYNISRNQSLLILKLEMLKKDMKKTYTWVWSILSIGWK